jgi:hypothetical protein
VSGAALARWGLLLLAGLLVLLAFDALDPYQPGGEGLAVIYLGLGMLCLGILDTMDRPRL